MKPLRCNHCNRLTILSTRFLFFSDPMCETCMKTTRTWTTK